MIMHFLNIDLKACFSWFLSQEDEAHWLIKSSPDIVAGCVTTATLWSPLLLGAAVTASLFVASSVGESAADPEAVSWNSYDNRCRRTSTTYIHCMIFSSKKINVKRRIRNIDIFICQNLQEITKLTVLFTIAARVVQMTIVIWMSSGCLLENGFVRMSTHLELYGAYVGTYKKDLFTVFLARFDSICGPTSNFNSFSACFYRFFVSRWHQMTVGCHGEFRLSQQVSSDFVIWKPPCHLSIPDRSTTANPFLCGARTIVLVGMVQSRLAERGGLMEVYPILC